MIADRLAAALVSLYLFAVPALAQDPAVPGPWKNGLSLFGDVKYPADFPHFDYVNPAAPKGGTVRQFTIGGYDSFNIIIPRGSPAVGLGSIYESLMTPSLDEPSSEYGLIAEAVRHPPDFSSVTFRLRPEARWQDGKPITVDDVIWSLQVERDNHPRYRSYYKNVVKAEATGEREVTFTFDVKGNRELPQILGQLLVLPKHYWEGTDANGVKRDITKTTLEPPLGSGPYRIKPGFQPGRSIAYRARGGLLGRETALERGHRQFRRDKLPLFP